MDARKQAGPIFTTVAVFVGIGVVLQLWLLSASLEAVLKGQGHLAVPATIASAFVLAVNGTLLLYVLRADRRTR
ncbi:MAG: DUF6755 family protein [Polyangiaceae bacterium]